MAIAATAFLRNYLAQTGDVEAAFAGGLIRYYTAGDVLLGSANIASATGNGSGSVAVAFSAGSTVAAGTAAKATVFASGGSNQLLTVSNVGTSGADINFDSVTWENGGTITQGNLTVDLTGL